MENSLERALTGSAIWYPNQESEEFLEEISMMLQRAFMVRDLHSGVLEADVFLDLLAEQGYNPFELAENCWNRWICST